MKPIVFALGFLSGSLLLAFGTDAPKTKTDLSRDVHVEYSVTNFAVTASAPKPSGKANVSFELSTPVPGPYRLVCYVDGKPSQPVGFKAPGVFEFSTRGLAPGTYRITLQLIDGQGGVGLVTKDLRIK
jgi:hypothetical protein